MAIIFLTGFMGSGKTTIGEKLAKKLGYPIVDTDQWIEQQEGMTIKQIFSEHGEAFFRELETKALKNLTGENLVVTTGGGMVIKAENRQLMKAKGTVFFLDCSLDEILKRTAGDTTRPLLNERPRHEVEQLLNERLPLYRKADYIIDTTSLSMSDIVAEIMRFLG